MRVVDGEILLMRPESLRLPAATAGNTLGASEASTPGASGFDRTRLRAAGLAPVGNRVAPVEGVTEASMKLTRGGDEEAEVDEGTAE